VSGIGARGGRRLGDVHERVDCGIWWSEITT
jgi:hypothetical protein